MSNILPHCFLKYFLCSLLSLFLSLSSLHIRAPSPLQHPQFLSLPNLSKTPTFHDVAIFHPLDVQFVLSVLRLISWVFRIFDIYLGVFREEERIGWSYYSTILAPHSVYLDF